MKDGRWKMEEVGGEKNEQRGRGPLYRERVTQIK